MKNFLALLSSTCGIFVQWFDSTIRSVAGLITDIANVAVRVLLAVGLYHVIFKGLLLEIVQGF